MNSPTRKEKGLRRKQEYNNKTRYSNKRTRV